MTGRRWSSIRRAIRCASSRRVDGAGAKIAAGGRHPRPRRLHQRRATLSLLEDVPYHLHPKDAIYPYDGTPGKVRFEKCEEGSTIRFGRATLTVEHTPGHTEGSVSYRLGDDLAFTGDFLFIASVGRPDLGGKTDEWTKVLWKSMERARASWPKGMRIYPAHYASARERNPDQSFGKPFGELLETNAPLAMKGEPEFTAWVKSKAGKFPDAYKTIKAINVGLRKATDLEAEELEAGKNECALG
ncbi:MAG: MBL fold metallo-hydrolase [Planctomycetes bacterium]|nr:MBL fold metallo-hydrolase [Planctomycetota bacterium]